MRLDSGRDARACVAWYQRKKRSVLEVGIEFVDCDNFWGLDWGTAGPNHSPQLFLCFFEQFSDSFRGFSEFVAVEVAELVKRPGGSVSHSRQRASS